jgi:alkylation response protein AidB-like acyl-CoA dehydrogenase
MDFEFTEEQRGFRDEVRAFLEEEVPPERQAVFGAEGEEDFQFARSIARKLAQRRWLTIGWPEEYGGGGKGQLEQAIFSEEMGYRRVPRSGYTGLYIVAPALMKFGTEDQKKKYLVPIANAEAEYCQGFSEPNAGSDLGSLELRALRDGDEYVLNGSKMFTSFAFRAQYIYLLARTDPDAPKHRGISLFIADVNTPGIEFRPLPYINGQMAAQTYFNDARLPMTSLIGEENRGWYHAMTTLDFERSGLERYASVRRTFDDFVDYCKTTRHNGGSLAQVPQVRRMLAERRIGMEMWRLLCYKVAWLQSTGAVPNAEASVAFLHGTEERLRFTQGAMQILGPYGTLSNESRWAPMRGIIEGIHRESMHLHGAGTTEVHRNIIAQRGLGLPR